jgi:hypothetical protein
MKPFFRPLLGAACLSAVLAVPASADTWTLHTCAPVVSSDQITSSSVVIVETCSAHSVGQAALLAAQPVPMGPGDPPPDLPVIESCAVRVIPIDPTQPLPVWVERIMVPEELAMERLP